MAKQEQRFLKNVAITRKATRTNIGILHEKGHKEAWIIAMSAEPGYYKTLDYGMRWGIKCMFSDLKSRGFSLEETQPQYTDRIERLVLIMALALYFATFCGLWDERHNPMPYEKRGLKKAARSLMSLFKRGLRTLRRCIILDLPIPWTIKPLCLN